MEFLSKHRKSCEIQTEIQIHYAKFACMKALIAMRQIVSDR